MRPSGLARALPFVVLLALAGCGFQPLYGESSGGGATLQQARAVAIAPIPDRVGQMVRNHLIDALTPRGQPRTPVYELTVALEQTKEGVAFQSDEQATRFNVTLDATFVLREHGTGNVLTRGGTRSVAAYNIVQSEFANITAEADAIRRAARQVADSIALRLGVYFKAREEARR